MPSLFSVLLLLVLPLAGPTQSKPEPTPTPVVLELGKTVTQRMRGGQAYDYQVVLKAGQALKATVA